MTEHDDDAFLDELRSLIARADPLPPLLHQAARASLTWRTVDVELAELVRDSADEETGALVRAATGHRMLSFEAPRVAVELEVVRTGERELRLTGQVLPAKAVMVVIEQSATRRTVPTDELGRFVAEGISAGPARMRIAFEGHEVALPWTTL